MTKTYIKAAIFIVAVLSASLLVRSIILNSSAIKTPPPSDLHDIVAAQLSQSSYSTPGDFKLNEVRYFEDKKWVVADLVPMNTKAADPDIVILKKSGDSYTIALGPGSNFPETTAKQLPESVQKYLRQRQAVGG